MLFRESRQKNLIVSDPLHGSRRCSEFHSSHGVFNDLLIEVCRVNGLLFGRIYMSQSSICRKYSTLTESPLFFVTIILSLLLFKLITADHLRADTSVTMAKPIRLGLVSYVGEAINFHALRQGYFKDKGLNIKAIINPSGSQSIVQLIDGGLDICTVESLPVAIYRLKFGTAPIAYPLFFAQFAVR